MCKAKGITTFVTAGRWVHVFDGPVIVLLFWRFCYLYGNEMTQQSRIAVYPFMSHFPPACSDDKCERCLQRGASYVLNYKTEKIVDLVKGMTKVGNAVFTTVLVFSGVLSK